MRHPLMAAVLFVFLLCSRPCLGETCPTITASIDTALADTSVLVALGSAYGQVVAITDTIVEAFTLWRTVFPESTYVPAQLFIMSTDSNGAPNTADVLFRSQPIAAPPSDGVHPAPYRFEFDPPLVLRSGHSYCFAAKEFTCLAAFLLIASIHDPYPGGEAWEFKHINFCQDLQLPTFPPHNDRPLLDLMFTIEYCDQQNPALRSTWGRVKARYR